MTRRARMTGGDGGFTLIELLVGLALMALMLALVGGALRFGARAWETADRVDRSQGVAAARAFLGQRVAESLPLVRWDERGVAQPTFHGARDQVRFLSAMPSRDGLPAGLFSTTLKLLPTRDGGAALGLELQQAAGPDPAPPVRRPVLVPGVSSLALRYYGPPERGAEPRWLDDWQGKTALPLLVEIDVRFPPGDERSWPPLVAELKLGDRTSP
jgi:general secretion pathway protein J